MKFRNGTHVENDLLIDKKTPTGLRSFLIVNTFADGYSFALLSPTECLANLMKPKTN